MTVTQAVDEGATFVPIAPRRVLDTRTGTGTGGQVGPVSGGIMVDLSTHLPATATAVVFNLTGTEPTATTFVRAYPVNFNVPQVSNLNLERGETRANLVTMALRPARELFLFNNVGTVHLIADLAGYYAPGDAARFTSMPPTRALDTRATAPVGQGRTLTLDLSGRVPASATAVTFNLTGTEPTSGTFVVAHPGGTAPPLASNLNLLPGQTSPNLVTVALGADRRVAFSNHAGSVHLVIDLAGYYAPDHGTRFFPVLPVRTSDSRLFGEPIGPGRTTVVNVAARLPRSASAAVLNLTGTSPSGHTFVTAFPYDTPRPLASNLNLAPGQTAANNVVVALGRDARITLYNNVGSVHLITDVAGFFATPTPCTNNCLYAWGGELGYGTVPARRPWLSGVTAVDATWATAYALRDDGTVWSWGDNQFGQLGAGGTDGTSLVPLQVSGLTGVSAIAAGTWAGYALKSDGTVWSWGWDRDGQLGWGRFFDSNVPVQVSGLDGVTAIAANHQSAYALKSDGSVWAWGSNVWGELGGTCPIGQHCPPGTPQRVALPTNMRFTAIAAGVSSTAYALAADGTVWAWGRDRRGETGTGSPPPTSVGTPTRVVGLTDVVAIDGGHETGYALKSDGTVWAWGNDYWGGLGSGEVCLEPDTSCQSNVPVRVSGLTEVRAIRAGTSTTFAVRSDGTVWAWGYNGPNGNLGNGTSGACPSLPQPADCRSTVPVRTTIGRVSVIGGGGLGNFAVVPS